MKTTMPKEVLSIRDCASQAEGRYAIHGVHVTHKRKPVAVATCGRALCWASWKSEEKNPENFDAILALSQLHAASKNFKKKDRRPALLTGETGRTDGEIEINAMGTTTTANAVDGIFPKWQQIIPHDREAMEFTFDVEVLTRLAETLKTITGKGAITLRISKGAKRPVLVLPSIRAESPYFDTPTGHKAVGVIMQRREDTV